MSLRKKITSFVEKIRDISVIKQRVESQNVLFAKLLNQHNFTKNISSLHEVEYKVFSQFGDDGIIQYLVHTLTIEPKTFVEFGVEHYVESNTRLLLINNNWSGLVMDGSKNHIDYIAQDEIFWRHNLKAVSAFITKENINSLLKDNGFTGEIGLLSIDIDGNDYWVWKEITVVNPVVVIVEYNSIFGADRAITIPYKSDFERSKVHYSNLHWGASLKALCILAEEKGYYFVGSNSAGNNAYFVRKDKIGSLKPIHARDGYVVSQFRDSRDEDGHLSFKTGDERVVVIRGLKVVNVETNKEELL